MLRPLLALLALSALFPPANAQTGTVLGDWREPGGSVLRGFSCGDSVCMKVMVLRPKEPLRFDIHDPDPIRHNLPLCEMQIGYDFHPEGPEVAPQVAKDGRVYDPESGHTYHAQMHIEDGQLRLRGYILFPALGRTEEWTRVTNLDRTCQ